MFTILGENPFLIPPYAYVDKPTFTPAEEAKTRIEYSTPICIRYLDDSDPVAFRNFHHLAGHPNLRKLDMGFARLTEADIAFLPSLPELAFLETHLSNLDMSLVDAILKRCPKLKYARI